MNFTTREDRIVLVIFAVVGLLIPGLVVVRQFLGLDPLALLHLTWGRTVVGVLFTVLAFLVCLWNAYLSFVVPWLYKRRHGSMAGFACTSGLPVIGGIFVGCAGALMPPSVVLGAFLLLLYVLDGYGLAWFFLLMAFGNSTAT